MKMDNYLKYRGKCREYSENLVKENSELILVRGWYYCPITNRKEQHWWCKDKDENIHDPTKLQFLSEGNGEYIEFDGYFECNNCGKKILEEDGKIYGRYIYCCSKCLMNDVLG